MYGHDDNAELTNAATVGDLKKFLEDMPDDMPIGVIGHFGEFYGVDLSDFYVSNLCRNKWLIKILELPKVDIGPEPD